MDPSGVNGFKKNESYGATAAINFTQVTTAESYSVRDSQNVFSHVFSHYVFFSNFLFLSRLTTYFAESLLTGVIFCLFQS